MTEIVKQEKGVQGTSTPAFIANATQSLEAMTAYADMLIQSGLVPKHFYETDQYRNPVKDANGKFKGNTAAVIMTIQYGLEVGMSITQSLQQIVPVNGLMSIKGDGAKALIMRSGKCKEWIEEEVGAWPNDDFGYKITSTRIDGQKTSSTFTIADAKRAGLWIDDAMVQKEAKFKHSPWYKYQKRMLRYRALGFLSRDLYGDVLQNLYTEEEARDIEVDNTVMVLDNGMTVKTATYETTKGQALNQAAALAADMSQPIAPAPEAPKPVKKAAKKGVVEPVTPIEEPQEAVVVESMPATPVKHTFESLAGLSGIELLQVLDQLLGANSQQRYFDANPEKRTARVIKEMIIACQDGMLDKVESKYFPDLNVQSAPTVEASKPQEEAVKPASEPRDFAIKLALMDKFEAAGYNMEMIDAAVKAKGYPYKDGEEFLTLASQEQIDSILNENA